MRVLTPENRFRAAALGGDNCFLTGAGGTGKSTQLRAFIAECPRRVSVTAPTGVAALNVGGMTIHRFCGMLLGPAAGQSNEDYFAQLQRDPRRSILAGFNRVRRCEVLVIDEISMLPGRQLEFVEFLFRRLRGRDEPFGGCQVIATGDFLQLPPVRTSETEPYDWAFQSPAWAAAEFRTFLLEKVRRQDEAAFVRALADFRVGRVWGDSARHAAIAGAEQSAVHHAAAVHAQRAGGQVEQVPTFRAAGRGNRAGRGAERAGAATGVSDQEPADAGDAAAEAGRAGDVHGEQERAGPDVSRCSSTGRLGRSQEVEPGAVVVKTKAGAVIRVERFTWRYDAQDDRSRRASASFRCGWRGR